MAKIKIKDLCNQLKNNIDEKSLFFKGLSAKEFLVPFYKEGIFSLTDNASYWVVQYLQRVYDKYTKDIILGIINQSVEKCEANDIDYSTYYQLVKLIDLFEITDIININYIKLLEHKNSIELVKHLYKKTDIVKYKDIVLATINSLLKYEVKTSSYKKYAKINYEIYYLHELINNEITRENFKMALTQEFVFDLLVQKYNEIYIKTHENINDISDVFSRQTINIDEISASFNNNYNKGNVLDIILYFLCLNLNNNSDISCNIKKLLSHKIFMLRKLGLYVIYINIDKYIDLLNIFFVNINRRNIVKVIDICLYEVVKIFKAIDEIDKPENLNEDINVFLQKFPKKYEEHKYLVLHGLKEHTEFKSMFNELKEKYQYEKEKPGIYWQSGVGGWVKNVSPISENEFRLKSITEQIEYLNSEIAYDHHLIQVDSESVEEVNERGLAELFKKLVEEDINKYLEDSNIYKINKTAFIKVFLEALSHQIKKIKSIKKAVLFIDKIFNIIKVNPEKYSTLLYELINFNIGLVNKRPKDFNKILKYIVQIAQNDYDESCYKNETDLSFVALNTTHGRNFRCYTDHIVKIRKLKEEDKDFISYILQENNEERFCTFYYYLGMQYEYISNRFKELNLLERIYKLKSKSRSYFLNGYLAYFSYLPQFIDLKSLILKSFANDEINDGQIRARFLRMLLDLKLRFNSDDIFYDFSKYFSENDYKCILNNLTYRDNPNYSKQMVINYWKDIVKIKNKAYTSSLLTIFNRYCDINDIKEMEKQLKAVIQSGLPDNLIGCRSIGEFLEKLLCFIKVTQNCAITYNLLDEIISSMESVKYIHNELDIIKEILKEFKNQNKVENAKLLSQKIYRTPSIKFFANNLKEFLV